MAVSEICVIENLLKNNFSERDFEERLLIIENGKPSPKLPNLRSSNKKCIRHFQSSWYEKKQWLTGSAKLNKLFCWPCLLFNVEKTVWNEKGYDDLNNLHMALLKHERSQRHIKSLIDLKMFGKVRTDSQVDAHKKLSILQHNEKVKHNRAILRRLIDGVIFLGRQELSFRGHFEREASNIRENYRELLRLIGKYDEKLAIHLNTASLPYESSNKIQNDIIDAIQVVMLHEIENELNQAKFVSILLDETCDALHCAQLSTVLRYVTKDCAVKERFIGFSDVSGDRSAKALSEHVSKIIETWNCEDKLITQTYDGATIITEEVNDLQATIRAKYKSAVLVHCSAHVQNSILSQACCALKECKIFFSTISELGAFFTKSTKRSNALDNIIKKIFPKASATRWNYPTRLINTVKEHLGSLIKLFENIIDNPDAWDATTINAAIGFHNHLEKTDFLFLVELFGEVFSFTGLLFTIFKTKNLNVLYCKEELDKTKAILENKLEDFAVFYEAFVRKCGIDTTSLIKKCKDKSVDPQQHYKMLYKKILVTIIEQLEVRYKSLEELKFKELLNFKKAGEYLKKFPLEALNSLKATYGHFFDIIRLQSELAVVYSMDEFKNQRVGNLMEYIKVNDIGDAMPELSKLCALILTLPSTTSSAERSFSALKRIKIYQKNITGDKVSGLAVMSIEKDLLQLLTQSEGFYDSIINIFAEKYKSIELIYK